MIKTTITAEQALAGFGAGIDCSQAVFAELAPQLGVERETALKISACFGGGMWDGETCGAVVGAIMAENKFGNVCRQLVQEACRICAGILNED